MTSEGMGVSPAMLQACPLFRGFTETGLTIFARAARVRELPRGMSLWRAGAAADGLVFVAAGSLEVTQDAAGRTVEVAVLEPGAYLGELSLVKAGSRPFTVRAKTPSRLVELKRAQFTELMTQKPQACLKLTLAILAALEERLRSAEPDIVAALSAPV